MAKVLGEKGLDLTQSKEAVQKSDEELLKIIVEGSKENCPRKNRSARTNRRILDYIRSLAK